MPQTKGYKTNISRTGIAPWDEESAYLLKVKDTSYNDTMFLATGNGYRYAFQGQEGDDELNGVGNSYTAEFWQYVARLGKRWEIDLVVKSHESPYVAFANNPIHLIDNYGLDTTVCIKSQTNGDGTNKFTENQMKSIQQDVQRIYDNNGIRLNVEIVDASDFDKNGLDDTDVFVEIRDNSESNKVGRTILTFDQVFTSWVNASAAKNSMQGEGAQINYQMGYVVAHEALHGLIGKAAYRMFSDNYGETHKLPGQYESHDNSAVNLNMDGKKLKEIGRQTMSRPTTCSDAEDILYQQQQFIRLFFDLYSPANYTEEEKANSSLFYGRYGNLKKCENLIKKSEAN